MKNQNKKNEKCILRNLYAEAISYNEEIEYIIANNIRFDDYILHYGQPFRYGKINVYKVLNFFNIMLEYLSRVNFEVYKYYYSALIRGDYREALLWTKLYLF